MRFSFLFVWASLMWALPTESGLCTHAADGSPPPEGACQGPLARLQAYRQYRERSSMCSMSQVEFIVDELGDSTADLNTPVIQCGECIPGTSNIDDGICDINEYCSDLGTCKHVTSHPFWGQSCNLDTSGHSGGGWCGAGLQCDLSSRTCVGCVPGALHAARSLFCNNSKWVDLGSPAAEALLKPADSCSNELNVLRDKVDGMYQMAVVAAVGGFAACALSFVTLIILIVCAVTLKRESRAKTYIADEELSSSVTASPRDGDPPMSGP